MTLRRATERLREVGSLPLLLTALLVVAGGDLSAQDRSRSRSNDSGPSRVAEPRGERSSPSPSAPSAPSEPRSASPSSPSSGSSASPSSPSRQRWAVPGEPGAPRRQPSYRDRRNPDRGHYGGGGWYRPYSSRWHRYGGYGYGAWWMPYGWGWFWLGDNYYPYDPYYYGDPYSRGGRRSYGDRDEVGALDLDVSPGRTQVFLDGQYLGTVDQFDGFPTYLWLDRGTYDVVLYLDGYKTIARQITIYPGNVINVDDRLERGESVRPEDIASKSHDRRDERIRFERERRERIDRGEDREDRRGDDRDESWRDRVNRRQEDRRDRGERTEGERIEIEIQDDRQDDRDDDEEQGRLRLDVEPDDASVYLDGKFIGTGRDLASARRGVLVEPGSHNVAVVRPGRRSVEREFEVEPGEEVELEIELESGN